MYSTATLSDVTLLAHFRICTHNSICWAAATGIKELSGKNMCTLLLYVLICFDFDMPLVGVQHSKSCHRHGPGTALAEEVAWRTHLRIGWTYPFMVYITLYMLYIWLIYGQSMVNLWLICDIWLIYDICLIYGWYMVYNVDNLWFICLVNVWFIDLHMVNIWCVYGLSMEMVDRPFGKRT